MSDDCPDPKCKIELIERIGTKISKNVLGISLAIIVATFSTIAYLTYDAYDNGRNVLAAEITKAKVLAESNREKISICDSNAKLIKQSLETINRRLREMKSDQREVNKKVLDSLEELKKVHNH